MGPTADGYTIGVPSVFASFRRSIVSWVIILTSRLTSFHLSNKLYPFGSAASTAIFIA